MSKNNQPGSISRRLPCERFDLIDRIAPALAPLFETHGSEQRTIWNRTVQAVNSAPARCELSGDCLPVQKRRSPIGIGKGRCIQRKALLLKEYRIAVDRRQIVSRRAA